MITAYLLVLFGVLLNALAIFAYQWVTVVPRLGIWTLYRIRPIRFALAAIASVSAAAGVLLAPGTITWLGFALVILLAPLSGIQHARRFLIPLDDPAHQAADDASLPPRSEILGYEVGGEAIAWPLDLLVPHHIINDQLAGRAVAATW